MKKLGRSREGVVHDSMAWSQSSLSDCCCVVTRHKQLLLATTAGAAWPIITMCCTVSALTLHSH